MKFYLFSFFNQLISRKVFLTCFSREIFNKISKDVHLIGELTKKRKIGIILFFFFLIFLKVIPLLSIEFLRILVLKEKIKVICHSETRQKFYCLDSMFNFSFFFVSKLKP